MADECQDCAGPGPSESNGALTCCGLWSQRHCSGCQVGAETCAADQGTGWGYCCARCPFAQLPEKVDRPCSACGAPIGPCYVTPCCPACAEDGLHPIATSEKADIEGGFEPTDSLSPDSKPAPVEVVTDWFASDLTWHSFQAMSDDEMAAAVLDALHAAGFLVMPATAFDPYQQTTDATGFSTTPKERP